MKYEVKITNAASTDLEEIYYYISKKLHANESAKELLSKIEVSILRLSDFPFAYSLVTDDLLREKGYRKLIVGNYIIFYLIDEENRHVLIMRVLYSRRDFKNLL
ncbi:type II toxin-antitoxin system RelE/ParE family toxin [Sporosarcina sp. FSL W8-0480]|uniref:type II toxin-antitoxin system RelE/ParE family toxin n=1 Tax=Sporosarcina sp. FSL W8-0480 TaxID=2954701 RepID=UPI0030DC8843